MSPPTAHLPVSFPLAAALLLVVLSSGSPYALAEEAPRAPDPKTEAKALQEAMRSEDPKLRLEAATQAAQNQEAALTSALIRLLADKDGFVRDAAIVALSKRSEKAARKKASSALTPRLPRLRKHPADHDELFLVIEALGTLAQTTAIKPLLDPIDGDMPLEEADARLQAVARIPEAESVKRLIQFLDKGRRGGRAKQKAAAQRALQTLTGHKASRDPDAWRAWWRENEKGFDFTHVAQERAAAEAARAEKEEARKRKAENRKKRKQEGDQGRGKKKKQPSGGTD